MYAKCRQTGSISNPIGQLASAVVAWMVLLPPFVAPAAAADPAQPYWGTVQTESTIHCGPGAHYYATANVRAGDRVEVYRREGEWLAIRPPRGSYSWVPSAQLKTTAMDDVMVARQDGVRVWIGTDLERLNKHHFQVELKLGEPIEVIGEKQLVTPSGDVADTWYKISPPAGEFRWLRASLLKADGAESAATSPVSGGVPFATAPIGESQGGDTLGGDAPMSEPRKDTTVADSAELREEISIPPAPPLKEPAELERVADGAMTANAAGQGQQFANSTADPSAVQPAARPEWLSWTPPADPVEFDRLLEQFNTNLATIVAQPTGSWDFTELRIKAAKMADGGPSALHRGKARKLQSSIEQFDTLAARLRRPNSAADVSATTNGSTPSGNGEYAGEGWLMPVHSTNNSVPKHAVVDNSGRFLKFVSAAPGVNLRRYEKTRVGIIGAASYLPSLDMPHVTAQRVVQLR